jgi:hypothetical protein
LEWEIATMHLPGSIPKGFAEMCFEDTKRHVEKGGLLLRPVSEVPS